VEVVPLDAPLRSVLSSRPPPSSFDDHIRCTVNALSGSVFADLFVLRRNNGSIVTDPRDPGDPPACLLILIERKRKRKEKDRKFISI